MSDVLGPLDLRFSSSSSLVLDESLKSVQAGDRTRTGDVQLGKLTFYH